jgi:uncharacterized protein YecE (DUF72 family)
MSHPRTAKLKRPSGIHIGISGWSYAGWRGVFYPPKLRQRDELAYASRIFRTIEINGTHYSLQRPESFAAWAAATPDDFVFAVKGSRYITHMKRLRDIETPLANFFAQGVLRLGAKLGPILWQFPPHFRFEPARITSFLALLPRDTASALELARRHDARLDGRAWLEIDDSRKLRHAMEIRHESFVDAEFIALLRKYGVALVCADTVEWPLLMDVTSDFIYCRLHGSEQLYASGYDAKAIAAWSRRVAAWARGTEPADAKRAAAQRSPKRAGRDVFVYFDNDAKVRAPFDAQALVAAVAKRLPAPRGTARPRQR